MRRHLTYANVAATLALVFAMTGGALAAKHYLINSTKQINPKVLKALKGRTGPKGATGAAGAPGAAGKDGTTGKTGDRGPSTAFSVNQENTSLDFPAKSLERQTVLALNLPAGNFSVVGKVVANNDSIAEGAEANCALVLGGKTIDPSPEVVRMTKEGAGADRATMVVAGDGTLSAAGTAEIACMVSSTDGTWVDGAINAIEVGSLG